MFFWVSARREYRETVANLREKKWLLSLEELSEKYPPSPPEKLRIYEEAAAGLAAGGRGMEEIKNGELTEENIMECRIALLDHPELFLKMDALAAVRELRFPLAWENGFSLELPHLNVLRNMARANAVRLALAARDNEWTQVREYLKTSFALRDIICNEPLVISALVSYAIESTRLAALQNIVLDGGLPHVDSAFLQELIADAESAEIRFRKKLPEVQITELSLFEGSMPDRLGDIPIPTPLEPFIGLYLASHHGLRDHAFCLNVFAEHIHDGGGDFYALTFKDHSTTIRKKYYLLANMASPWSQGVLRRASLIYASLRTFRTALAAELYRRKYGAFPETLEKLVPEFLPAVPIDPFTGKALLYKKGALPIVFREEFTSGFDSLFGEVETEEPEEFGDLGPLFGEPTKPEPPKKEPEKTKKKEPSPPFLGIVIYSTGADKTDDEGQPNTKARYTNTDIVFGIPGKE